MEVLALIDQVRNATVKKGAKPKANQPLDEYSGKTPAQLKNMLRTMLLARRIDVSQEAEIAQMRAWPAARGEPAPELHRTHGHAHGTGQKLMPGMLTDITTFKTII